ncbi:MAG: S8 family serine peptidase [Candidatus Aenigmarchaeota archaeon]|nr:S8 family serine peptidase [Candidatus Aenigmarchaeota archaeon]
MKKLDWELKESVYSKPNEKVRVIVWLDKSNGLSDLERIGKVRYDYDVISAVAMELSSDQLENLARVSSVKKIVLDREIRAFRIESMAIIKASTAASNFNVNGSNINISIIDTGIFNHTEFQTPNRIVKQKCYCNVAPGNCCQGLKESENATDDHGHGTHCAGIAAGEGNGHGHGVATNVSLFAVKVLNASGSGTESDLIAGIDWAVRNGTNIISLSLGATFDQFTDCYEVTSSEVVDNATKQGVVVVVAAGNEGSYGNETIAAPGCAKRAITVGAVDDADSIASFSSRGPTTDNRTKPDLVAPGVSITSTTNGLTSYGSASGTSQATPHVAGVAALLMQRFLQTHGYLPEPDRVKAILLTAVNTTGMNASGYQQRNNVYGAGRIDAYEALRIINFTKNKTISQGQEDDYKINVTNNDFKVTLYWPEDEDTNNNLDLIIRNFTDPTKNISFSTHANDSIEQVFVRNASNGFWEVFVRGVVGTNQTYYLASNVEILEDVTPPSLVLVRPENKTYTNRTNIPLNFSTDETNHTVWYTLDGENETVITGNTTFNVSSDGPHNITLYVNDSYNNINQSTQYFSVDTVPPVISIVSPVSNVTMNYSTKMIWFNISLNEHGNVSLFSVDAGENFTMDRMNDTYFYNLSTIPEGFHSVAFYVNDSVGWTNSSSVNFTIMINPNITDSRVDKRLVLLNESVNITANIFDDNLASVLTNITWPNGIYSLRNMSNSSSMYYYLFNATNQTGKYNVLIIVNDTFGNENNASLEFEVSGAVNVSSNVMNGTTAINVSVIVLYNGTNHVRNETTNTSFEFILPAGLWDLRFNTTRLNVTLFSTNLTENLTREIRLNDDVRMSYVLTNVRSIKTVALKFENFTFSSANLTFSFDSSLVNNRSNLEVYRCQGWSFANSDCESSWQRDSSDDTFNATINENNVTLITSNFSSFSLGENETITTTSTSTTTTISGGGGAITTTSTTIPITTSTTIPITTSTTVSITTSTVLETTTLPIGVSEREISHLWFSPLIVVFVVILAVVVYYLRLRKKPGVDEVFEDLKEKWSQHTFVVRLSFT